MNSEPESMLAGLKPQPYCALVRKSWITSAGSASMPLAPDPARMPMISKL